MRCRIAVLGQWNAELPGLKMGHFRHLQILQDQFPYLQALADLIEVEQLNATSEKIPLPWSVSSFSFQYLCQLVEGK